MKNVIIHVWKIMRPVVLKFDLREFDGEGGFLILFEKSKLRVNWKNCFYGFVKSLSQSQQFEKYK